MLSMGHNNQWNYFQQFQRFRYGWNDGKCSIDVKTFTL